MGWGPRLLPAPGVQPLKPKQESVILPPAGGCSLGVSAAMGCSIPSVFCRCLIVGEATEGAASANEPGTEQPPDLASALCCPRGPQLALLSCCHPGPQWPQVYCISSSRTACLSAPLRDVALSVRHERQAQSGQDTSRVTWVQRGRGGLCGQGGDGREGAGSVPGRTGLQSRKPRHRNRVSRSDLHTLGTEAGMGGEPRAGQQGAAWAPDVGRTLMCNGGRETPRQEAGAPGGWGPRGEAAGGQGQGQGCRGGPASGLDSLHRPAGVSHGSAMRCRLFCLAARVSSSSKEPAWGSRVPRGGGPGAAGCPPLSSAKGLPQPRLAAWGARQLWRIPSAVSSPKCVRPTWSEGRHPAPCLTWVLSQPLDSNRNCRATRGAPCGPGCHREADLAPGLAAGRDRGWWPVRGWRGARWRGWAIPGAAPRLCLPALPGAQARRERGRLSRAPPAVSTSAPWPRVGRLNLSHHQRGSPPQCGRGSGKPPQGDGGLGRALPPPHPGLSAGGPGAVLAGSGPGSSPHPAPTGPAGTEAAQAPVATWPGAGGRGGGRWPLPLCPERDSTSGRHCRRDPCPGPTPSGQGSPFRGVAGATETPQLRGLWRLGAECPAGIRPGRRPSGDSAISPPGDSAILQ